MSVLVDKPETAEVPPNFIRPNFERMPVELKLLENWVLWVPIWNGYAASSMSRVGCIGKFAQWRSRYVTDLGEGRASVRSVENRIRARQLGGSVPRRIQVCLTNAGFGSPAPELSAAKQPAVKDTVPPATGALANEDTAAASANRQDESAP